MRFFDLFRTCFQNLFKRPGRTILTALGIVIGTSAVIVMISLGIGLNAAFDGLISQFGDLTTIYVTPKGEMDESGMYSQGKITEQDLASLRENPHITGIKSLLDVPTSEVCIRTGDYVYTGPIVGVYMDQIGQFGYTLDQGSFYKGEGDPEESMIFGSEAAYFFSIPDDDDPVQYMDEMGNYILPPPVDINTDSFEIMPVQNKKEDRSKANGAYSVLSDSSGENENKEPDYATMFDDDFLDQYAVELTSTGLLKRDVRDYYTSSSIFIDIRLAQRMITESEELNNVENPSEEISFSNIEVKADDISSVPELSKWLESLNYYTYSAESQRQSFQGFTQVIQLVLGGLAGISLLVAAIGISNTMIMSITERTREIGVMKVLGCTIGNIRSLFLMEAGAIGFLGGLVGTGFSFLLSKIINQIALQYAMQGGGGQSPGGAMDLGALLGSGTISIIPLWLVLFALLFATAIGVFSGFYPANRAVKISPLAAIHHD